LCIWMEKCLKRCPRTITKQPGRRKRSNEQPGQNSHRREFDHRVRPQGEHSLPMDFFFFFVHAQELRSVFVIYFMPHVLCFVSFLFEYWRKCWQDTARTWLGESIHLILSPLFRFK
jgi:hypothetical protein